MRGSRLFGKMTVTVPKRRALLESWVTNTPPTSSKPLQSKHVIGPPPPHPPPPSKVPGIAPGWHTRYETSMLRILMSSAGCSLYVLTFSIL